MMAPCSVNSWLYTSAVTPGMVWPGVSSSVRTSSANTPPTKKLTNTATMYITPMRLWSSVSAQLMKPRVCVR